MKKYKTLIENKEDFSSAEEIIKALSNNIKVEIILRNGRRELNKEDWVKDDNNDNRSYSTD